MTTKLTIQGKDVTNLLERIEQLEQLVEALWYAPGGPVFNKAGEQYEFLTSASEGPKDKH